MIQKIVESYHLHFIGTNLAYQKINIPMKVHTIKLKSIYIYNDNIVERGRTILLTTSLLKDFDYAQHEHERLITFSDITTIINYVDPMVPAFKCCFDPSLSYLKSDINGIFTFNLKDINQNILNPESCNFNIFLELEYSAC